MEFLRKKSFSFFLSSFFLGAAPMMRNERDEREFSFVALLVVVPIKEDGREEKNNNNNRKEKKEEERERKNPREPLGARLYLDQGRCDVSASRM